MSEQKPKPCNMAPNLSSARPRAATTLPSGAAILDSAHAQKPGPSDWQIPKKPVKITANEPVASASGSSCEDNNRFRSLSVGSADMDAEVSDDPTDVAGQSKASKTHRPPPIYSVGISLQALIQLAKNVNLVKGDFIIKEVGAGSHTIYINRLEHFELFKNKLTEAKIHFYTYTPKGQKPKSLIVKGIRGDFSCDDIRTEIQDLQLANVEIISLNKFHFNKKDPDRFYHILQVTSSSQTAELFKIKSLAFQKVRWEHLKKPTIYQCRKCQRLGHASKNCNLPFRCVKCAQTHDPGSCPITEAADKSALKCANCGQEGHPASYSGCPFIKFAMQRKKSQTSSQVQQKLRSIGVRQSMVRRGTSFAQALDPSRGGDPSAPPTAESQRTSYPLPGKPDGNQVSSRTPPPPPQPSESPSWLNEFKAEISLLVSQQLKSLTAQISANSEKIEFILNSLFNLHNG